MVQALINLAVVLRLLPIAGVPLPLVSYGGSALIANLLAVGVLLGCARREPAARRVLARKSRRSEAADDHGRRLPDRRAAQPAMTPSERGRLGGAGRRRARPATPHR